MPHSKLGGKILIGRDLINDNAHPNNSADVHYSSENVVNIFTTIH